MCEGMSDFKQDYYDHAGHIHMRDRLWEFLGSTDEGQEVEYGFSDVIKFAGHACPAVSGAFKMTQKALYALYGEETPERGEIKVAVLGAATDGANGPMAQVVSYITGAATETGFEGIGGKFSRSNKLIFDKSSNEGSFIFQREDTGKTVKISYHPELLPSPEGVGPNMMKMLKGTATAEEKEKFVEQWHHRVGLVLFDEVEGLFDLEEIDGYKF